MMVEKKGVAGHLRVVQNGKRRGVSKRELYRLAEVLIDLCFSGKKKDADERAYAREFFVELRGKELIEKGKMLFVGEWTIFCNDCRAIFSYGEREIVFASRDFAEACCDLLNESCGDPKCENPHHEYLLLQVIRGRKSG